MKTLVITRQDVEAVLDMTSAMAAVEEAFRLYGLGRFRMPPKMYLDLPEHQGDFRAMPAYLHGDFQAAGLKWVNVHPGNAGTALPTVMGVLVYSDPATGFPLALMDATHLTRVRTGAAGGVAAKYLAQRTEPLTVGLVGCGAQAAPQLHALRKAVRVGAVRACDVRRAAAEAFAADMQAQGVAVTVTDDAEACVREADVVVSTTPVRSPVVRGQWLRPGCHVNAIGADAAGKQEYTSDTLARAKVVVDDWTQASHSGEINVPVSAGLFRREDVHASLGEVVAGLRPGRERDDEITLFDSTGLAIQDIAVARSIYEACRDRGMGMEVQLI